MQTNWAGNLVYGAQAIHHPRSMDELCDLVRRTPKIRALGTRHCFNGIADSAHGLVALDQMPRVMELDAAGGRVTVDGAARYGEVGAFLQARGFALHNMASLPHISVAGAVATATHGSGNANACLSSAVAGMEIVAADGTWRTYTRQDDFFNGLPVHLGALWIVTKLTLEIQPAFSVRQTVYENLPIAAVEDLAAITAGGYSVSLFTDWRGPVINQVWLKQRCVSGMAEAPATYFGAAAAHADRHPIAEISAENCTAAPFPDGLHAQRRRGTAERILRGPEGRRGGDSGSGVSGRPHQPAAVDF